MRWYWLYLHGKSNLLLVVLLIVLVVALLAVSKMVLRWRIARMVKWRRKLSRK
jgi:hypothetical protein